jgi:MoaA/NifB/PqqE/SkfB family radical SAM enzyme
MEYHTQRPEEIRGRSLFRVKPAVNLYLSTNTVCNIHCKSCPRGRGEPELGGMMSLKMLERILEKATVEARVITVQLYRYNEPFLIPHIADMVAACHQYGIPVLLSTNLSSPAAWENVPKTMKEKPETLLISVSGYTQTIYERSHKGGDIEYVKNRMHALAQIVEPETTVQVSWHRYKYNEFQMRLMRFYSDCLGFNFVPYGTSLFSHDLVMEEWKTGKHNPAGEDLVIPVSEAKAECLKRKWWPCVLQDQILGISASGHYLRCPNFINADNILGDFFNKSIPDILSERKQDQFCEECRKVGAHVYAAQAYTRPEYSPIVLAEFAYRKLGLAGMLPWFSRWCSENLYRIMRP